MSNGKNSSHSGLPEFEESKDTQKASRSRKSLSTLPFIHLLSRLFIAILVGMHRELTRLAAQLSRSMKRGTQIAALVTAVVLAGHAVSAQVNPPPPPPPLSQVSVPEPNNIKEFIKDKVAAIALGKTLFWDMQVGSDGIQTCASCHFHAGADNRSKNQISPGLLDTTFHTGGNPNYQLTAANYPFHKLADPNNRSSSVISDSNDVTGSQGVFRSEFVDVVPGSDKDKVTPLQDEVFNVNDTNVRRVTPRNTPTVINAVFNFRNFWDGRAQNIFNGVNPLGLRDPNAYILKASNPRRLEDVKVSLNNSSLASQAVGPPLNAFETAAENTTIIAPFIVTASESDDTVRVLDANGRAVNNSAADESFTNEAFEAINENISDRFPRSSTSQTRPFRRFGRKLGKKLLALKPLGKQIVAYDDSVLGSLSNSTSSSPKPGLKKSYEEIIQDAFQPEWWDSNVVIRINPRNGRRIFIPKPKRPLTTNEYTLAEYNFSLFFGLAVQAYESTLISDQTPVDKNALTQEQKQGLSLFQGRGCIGCHSGPEFTSATVGSVRGDKIGGVDRLAQQRIKRLPPVIGTQFVQDTGFFNIGVRPKTEDKGVGDTDSEELGNNPLSEVQLAQQGKFNQLLGEAPPILNPTLGQTSDIVIADGAFKTPGLRNVELTAPYFHNGGLLTLEQVVDFYNRGGDFQDPTNILRPLRLTDAEKQQLVAFMKALTDERVRLQKAPFDHPQLFIPNGHPGNQNFVTNDPKVQTQDGTKQATDALLQIPAVGRNGGNPLPNFLENS